MFSLLILAVFGVLTVAFFLRRDLRSRLMIAGLMAAILGLAFLGVLIKAFVQVFTWLGAVVVAYPYISLGVALVALLLLNKKPIKKQEVNTEKSGESALSDHLKKKKKDIIDADFKDAP